MAIHELNEEQVRTWTLEEKDTWWLKNVFRGDMPQLTLRSAATGMLLGGVLSLTNLYIGAKTGWTLGVGITSVILAYAFYRVLSRIGLGSEFTILENNAMQSIATAAGYMTSPMISSLAAYMMVSNNVIPLWQTMLWIAMLAILGVLFAFPFKRRFINEEQQPFPEGRAAGVVMDSLHHGEARSSMLKAQLLVGFSALAALVRLAQSEGILSKLKLPHLPESLDDWLYKYIDVPKILGTPLPNLTLRPELDLSMIGAGGLMGMRTGFSVLLGAIINYAILAPIMIQRDDIKPSYKGPALPALTASTVGLLTSPAGHGAMLAASAVTPGRVQGTLGFREITFWALWCGVAMMTVASLLAFFAKPQILVSAFSKLFQQSEGRSNVLDNIELPLSVSVVGIPVLGALVVWCAHRFFGVEIWLGIVAVFLVFVFCLIAINSTGLTSITPIGAMGKLTQLTYGFLAPGNITTNLMTAGITGEVASHSANLLQDIKPGYMLGAKPRQQAVGHVLGVIAGALFSVPVFYLVFLEVPPADLFSPSLPPRGEVTFKDPMPAATVWRAVAEILTQGLSKIPRTAQVAAAVGILVGLLLETIRLISKNQFPLSPVGIGLGFVIPFPNCLSMFIGALIFWGAETFWSRESKVHEVVVKNQEPICAGLIAGWALTGIVVIVVELFVLPRL